MCEKLLLITATLLFLGVATAELTLADPVVAGEEHCVVNVRPNDVLNMRARPSSSAEIVARKRHNECGIRVNRSCRQNWCPVEDGHSLGWVHQRYLAMVSPAMYCVTGIAIDVISVIIAFLPYAVGGWQKVRVAAWQGWVNRRYLSAE